MIELTGIAKSYRIGTEEVAVLQDVNLRVAAGEFVALLGPSGSGKTTLMNIIGCLDAPTTGAYRLDGREVSALSPDQIAKVRNLKIGFVFQNFYLLPRMTALRNVELPMVYASRSRAIRRERARALLEQVGLADRVSHRPNELSGGQKQRVAIARAMANEPPILLADEPTGSLDSQTSQQILRLIQEINAGGTTVVLITHDEAIAAYARRVIRIRDGRVESDREVVPC
ncbi:MAG: ABC transporter ATP-binding protein [Firmicutes bacterium]|nr:ABC transporter ATP-binding protein [Bacillota bacterium]